MQAGRGASIDSGSIPFIFNDIKCYYKKSEIFKSTSRFEKCNSVVDLLWKKGKSVKRREIVIWLLHTSARRNIPQGNLQSTAVRI